MAPSPIRIALLGYGLAGRVFHAPLIQACEGAELAAIVTGNIGRQKDVRERYPAASVLGSAAELWSRAEEIDVVVIATPNRTHAPLALDAIAHRLAVVIDKPLAPDASTARQLVAAANKADLVCTVFHNRRYDADFLTLRQLLSESAVGEPIRLESHFERWRPHIAAGWRERADADDAGGILYDLGPHLIDQALVLFGAAQSVYAEMNARRLGSRVDDDTFVSILHDSGVRSHLFMSALAARSAVRFHLLGSTASWTKTGLDVQEQMLADGWLPSDPGFGDEPREQWGQLGTDESSTTTPGARGTYSRFYEQLVTALRSGGPPPVDPLDAIAGLEVIEAAQHSARLGRTITFGD